MARPKPNLATSLDVIRNSSEFQLMAYQLDGKEEG
jgi:hypothetical protein